MLESVSICVSVSERLLEYEHRTRLAPHYPTHLTHLGLEHPRTRANAPRNNRLRQPPARLGLGNAVLFHAAHLAQHQHQLALGIRLEPQQMVNERCPRVPCVSECCEYCE